MPYELIITDLRDMSSETIGFGEAQAIAENVFAWTWHGLLNDGYRSVQNAQTPHFIEIISPQGHAMLHLELDYRPTFDIANLLRAIHLAALDVTYPKYFATGVMQAEVVLGEKAWKQAKHEAHITGANGLKTRYPLVGERAEALKAFNEMVRERGCNGRIVRCVDADLKWMALDEAGATTLEFVEVQA